MLWSTETYNAGEQSFFAALEAVKKEFSSEETGRGASIGFEVKTKTAVNPWMENQRTKTLLQQWQVGRLHCRWMFVDELGVLILCLCCRISRLADRGGALGAGVATRTAYLAKSLS